MARANKKHDEFTRGGNFKSAAEAAAPAPPAKKRRGRPPKAREPTVLDGTLDLPGDETAAAAAAEGAEAKRAKPGKIVKRARMIAEQKTKEGEYVIRGASRIISEIITDMRARGLIPDSVTRVAAKAIAELRRATEEAGERLLRGAAKSANTHKRSTITLSDLYLTCNLDDAFKHLVAPDGRTLEEHSYDAIYPNLRQYGLVPLMTDDSGRILGEAKTYVPPQSARRAARAGGASEASEPAADAPANGGGESMLADDDGAADGDEEEDDVDYDDGAVEGDDTMI